MHTISRGKADQSERKGQCEIDEKITKNELLGAVEWKTMSLSEDLASFQKEKYFSILVYFYKTGVILQRKKIFLPRSNSVSYTYMFTKYVNVNQKISSDFLKRLDISNF